MFVSEEIPHALTSCASAASGFGSAANPPEPPAPLSCPGALPQTSAAAGWTPGGWNDPSCSPLAGAERLKQLPRRKPKNPSQLAPQHQSKRHPTCRSWLPAQHTAGPRAT